MPVDMPTSRKQNAQARLIPNLGVEIGNDYLRLNTDLSFR